VECPPVLGSIEFRASAITLFLYLMPIDISKMPAFIKGIIKVLTYYTKYGIVTSSAAQWGWGAKSR